MSGRPRQEMPRCAQGAGREPRMLCQIALDERAIIGNAAAAVAGARVGGRSHEGCPSAVESRGIMIMPSGDREMKQAIKELKRRALHNADAAYYVLSRDRHKTYSLGVMSTRTSFHSSVGISARRRSISASPVETICTTAA